MDRGNSVSEAYLPTLFNNDEIQRGPRVKLGGGSIGSMLAKRYTAAIPTNVRVVRVSRNQRRTAETLVPRTRAQYETSGVSASSGRATRAIVRGHA